MTKELHISDRSLRRIDKKSPNHTRFNDSAFKQKPLGREKKMFKEMQRAANKNKMIGFTTNHQETFPNVRKHFK